MQLFECFFLQKLIRASAFIRACRSRCAAYADALWLHTRKRPLYEYERHEAKLEYRQCAPYERFMDREIIER